MVKGLTQGEIEEWVKKRFSKFNNCAEELFLEGIKHISII